MHPDDKICPVVFKLIIMDITISVNNILANLDAVAEIVRAIKKEISIPLFVKLTPEGGQIAKVATALYAAGADAVPGYTFHIRHGELSAFPCRWRQPYQRPGPRWTGWRPRG